MGVKLSKVNVPIYTNNSKTYREYNLNSKKHDKSSKGEKIIEDILNIKKIPFLREFNHPNLKFLRYDFLILYNSNPILIEFDGKQHFDSKSCNHFNTELFDYQERDRIKTQLAKFLKIKLIRIDYTKFYNILYFLDIGLKSSNLLYLSDPDKYQYLYKPSTKTINKYLININVNSFINNSSLCIII